jgi:hypothetical protein
MYQVLIDLHSQIHLMIVIHDLIVDHLLIMISALIVEDDVIDDEVVGNCIYN